MGPADNDDGSGMKNSDFKSFAAKRITMGLLILAVGLWIIGTVLGYFSKETPPVEMLKARQGLEENNTHKQAPLPASKPEARPAPVKTVAEKPTLQRDQPKPVARETLAGKKPVADTIPRAVTPQTVKPAVVPTPRPAPVARTTAPTPYVSEEEIPRPVGWAFVNAAIAPIDYEVNQRFWGWRPNDILDFTDNVDNYQLGVLEVTRRTTVVLSERLSRIGTGSALDPDLENAVNWLMVKAEQYWFPSPEWKYNESIKELKKYLHRLEIGQAAFYTRADALIPLLGSFEELLGSCTENLVKEYEDDGSKVSMFRTDDYFYYAQGVAGTMTTILKGVEKDFHNMLASRDGLDSLRHAIQYCERAANMKPWFITDSALDGIFANHRANLSAPLNQARFYINNLIKTLST